MVIIINLKKYMNLQNKIKTNLLYNLNNTYILYNTLRNLANDNKNNNNTKSADEIKKAQLKELYIIIAALVALIILILGGYALYRHFIEKKLIQEIEQENAFLINVENSSRSSSSQENSRPYSFNNVEPKIQNYDSEIDMQNNHNNSFDFNHEERMEKIRKKYGNSLVIKILLKKKLEEAIYNKTFKDYYGDNCTICMSNFSNNVIIYKTPCEHIFHKECFNRYLKNIKNQDKLICPNCNQNLIINKKYLKLRKKSEKNNIEKDKLKLDINYDKDKKEISNCKEVTSKKIEMEIDDDSLINNKESVIIIKKTRKEEINSKETKEKKNLKNNIYNPSIDLKYQNTENIKNKEDEINIENDYNDLYRKKKDKDINIMNEKSENDNEININNKKDKIKNSKINKKNNISDNNNIQLSLNSRRDFINGKI